MHIHIAGKFIKKNMNVHCDEERRKRRKKMTKRKEVVREQKKSDGWQWL